MSVAAILEEVARRGITLEPDGNVIRYRAPRGNLTPELREALLQHKEQIIAALTASTSRPVKARLIGSDRVVESPEVRPCWHCHGAKVCECITCAVPSRPMGWQAGECQSCLGTGYLVSSEPAQARRETKPGCPGPELCADCYEVGQRADGTPIRLHPPKGRPIAWPKPMSEKIQ